MKETRLKFSQGSIMVLQHMANYEEARVRLTNMSLHKLQSAAKNKNGTTLRKNVQDERLPDELLLTTWQKTIVRNVFAKNMLTDIKFSKAQLSKKIQPGSFLGKLMSNIGIVMGILGTKAVLNLAVPLVKNVLLELASDLVTKTNSNAINNFERKISGQGDVRLAKGIILFNSNEDMDDIITIIEALEKSSLFADGASKTVKQKKKK